MELTVEIETDDKRLETDLFESREFSAGETEKVITEGVSIRWEGVVFRKAVGFPEIINIALVIGEKVVLPIAVSIVAKWLYDKIKGRASKVTINYTVVEINADKIEKLILEKLKKEREP